MKEVKAYIRRERMDAVIHELAQIEGVSGVSASTVTGFGRSRGVLKIVNFETHVKLEIVCADELKEQVVQSILRSGNTGTRGDGKVFVSTVDEAYRVENCTCLTE
ncbi:MAG TPA: transcriptional regulator [Opitutae bacterium]|jgi:nitrogen regulatory protein PII|nr:transcriptional regulator [Puniceicoccaceae bacterium]HBR95741.1 transcriptional regulator [Opitutae bacterium]|tara:strand:- start:136 stop:450 length:315 start_codon:yes stop_codon:yes gene_type:complete